MSRARLGRWLAAALIGAVIASAMLLSDLSSLRDQRDDRDLFLQATSDGWAEASTEFFRTPAAAADLIELHTINGATPLTLQNLLAAVRLDDDIDAAFVGYPDGRFLFAARSEDGGFRSRSIPADDAADDKQAELVWFDRDLSPIRTASESTDYDPRQRPWYLPVHDGAATAWSDPYTFSSSGQPGITYSADLRDDAGVLSGVVGIDVRLTALDEFLHKLRPGASGIAAILDGDGSPIASAGGSEIADDDIIDQLIDDVALPDRVGENAVSPLPGGRTASARHFGSDGAWTLVAIADDADFIEGDMSRPLRVLRWLLIAVPTALVVGALLRPATRRLRSLYHGATRDDLTGVANRATITTELRRALEHPRLPVTVAIVDLDGFKPINDTWGHHQGDVALQAAAQRLEHFAHAHNMGVGRLGGDEFLLVATGHAAEDTDRAWPLLVASMARPLDLDDAVVRIGASVGVADVPTGADRDHETSMRHADRALYEVKRSGGNAWLRHVDVAIESLDDMWNAPSLPSDQPQL